MAAHILLSPVGQKTETRFNCLLTENRKSAKMVGTPSTAAAVPLPRGGRSGDGEVEGLNNVGGRAMRAPTMLRKKASAHCTAVPVGARIARPFIPDVITTLREGVRRVIGATAKPLYPIDGKAEGLDRRTPQTSLFEGGGPPAGGGRSERRSARPRGLGGDFDFSPLNPLGTP